MAPMTVADLGIVHERMQEQLPPFWKLFAPGQFRWTATGILCGICAGTVYYLIAILLPKALVSQGSAVALSFGLSSLVFAASIPGKLFNGFIMEIIGRRWTITGAFLLSIPGLLLMVVAHRAGPAATIVFSAGALITGFTTLSIFPAVRMYLSEQFPTALRGRGTFFRGVVRTDLRRCDRALRDGLAHRFTDDLFWDNGGHGRDRRLHSVHAGQGDPRQSRNLHRGVTRVRLTPVADSARTASVS